VLKLNHTHDIRARSWVESANVSSTDFPIQNLPYSIFRRSNSDEALRGCVAIGDQVVDVSLACSKGLFSGLASQAASACGNTSLNFFAEMGEPAWSALRHALFGLLDETAISQYPDQVSSLRSCLVPQIEIEHEIPFHIGDYTDYYTSIAHAVNSGRLFNSDLPEGFRWIPMAYHGRVSTIGIAGQEFRRPKGQILAVGADSPQYLPTQKLDYECELGIFMGTGNAVGEPISLIDAESHVFGLCMLNDWSARDIQAWEMKPLGPFHAKNFATTLSPWIVSMEALTPYRKPLLRETSDPQSLPYLQNITNEQSGAFDIMLDVSIETARMREDKILPKKISRTTFAHQYWTVAQMVTHHAAGGCNLRSGDLLGTGTISGPTPSEAGTMIELSKAGSIPVPLGNGEERGFLADGDVVILTGWCERPGYARIGFGRNFGRVLSALGSIESDIRK
jgi:fumarylacetoacetase